MELAGQRRCENIHTQKEQEIRLKWVCIENRRIVLYVGKRVMVMEVPEKRRRGRPKREWLDKTRIDLSDRELLGEEAQSRVKWIRLTRNSNPI